MVCSVVEGSGCVTVVVRAGVGRVGVRRVGGRTAAGLGVVALEALVVGVGGRLLGVLVVVGVVGLVERVIGVDPNVDAPGMAAPGVASAGRSIRPP